MVFPNVRAAFDAAESHVSISPIDAIIEFGPFRRQRAGRVGPGSPDR